MTVSIVYVDRESGNDKNTGSKRKPVKSIAAARALMTAGAKGVRLMAGQRHTGYLSASGAGFSLTRYGKPDAPNPVIDAEAKVDATIVLTSTTGAIIDSVEVCNGRTEKDTAYCISAVTAINGARFRGLTITGGSHGVNGFSLTGSDNLVSGSVFEDQWVDGLSMGGDGGGDGIRFDAEDCDFLRVGARNSGTGPGDGVTAHGSNCAVVARRCRFIDCLRGASFHINTGGPRTNLLDRCLIVAKDAASLVGQYSDGSADTGITDVENCILIVEGSTSAQVALMAGAGGRITAKNSLMVNRSTGALAGNVSVRTLNAGSGALAGSIDMRSCVSYVDAAQHAFEEPTNKYTGDKNLFFRRSSGNGFQLAGLDFAGWKSRTSEDANSVESDPQIVNWEARDESIAAMQSGSPLINLGFEDLSEDYYGKTRVGATCGPVQYVGRGGEPLRVVRPMIVLSDLFAEEVGLV